VRLQFWYALGLGARIATAATPADTIYEHGYVYTVDLAQPVQQAVAVRDGRIIYVGNDTGVQAFIGPQTRIEDLRGRMMMPGLVDGHMHPLAGGHSLLGCNLNYERLTEAQFATRIQSCLNDSRDQEPNGWLAVRNWFQEAMIGNTVMSRAVLDRLNTRRPIFVLSSFGHTALANSRALTLAHIDAHTPDPRGGQIHHDARGEPTGLLEDAAMRAVQAALPPPTAAEDVKAAAAAVSAVNAQGVTTFLDAAADRTTLAAFAAVAHDGKLTVRAHFAVLITPQAAVEPIKAVASAHALAQQYDQGPLKPRAGLSVHNIKLFLDGVITAPAMTGNMMAPYLVNQGTAQQPHWVPGPSSGPAVYFQPATLKVLLPEAARLGLEPHFHADGDGAVHAALDATAMLRQQFPPSQIRVAIAHDEIVDPRDFLRYQALAAVPVLSFQWEKPAPDTVDGARDYLGPERYRFMEPAAFLADAGAPIAYGSDWPVDRLDEWFALKVGVTRANAPDVDPKYRGRLSQDRGLTRAQVLRAITLGSAYELHEDASIGSIEPGKLADLVILDRNVMQIPAEDIAHVHVLTTIVGGERVYRAASH
jgi:predicted amidohydrolase YtcJ